MLKVLVADDDTNFNELFKKSMERCKIKHEVDFITEPELPDEEYDIYFLDNLFSEEPHARKLACAIKAKFPEAYIVVFTIIKEDYYLVKKLIGIKIDEFFEKSEILENGHLPKIFSYVEVLKKRKASLISKLECLNEKIEAIPELWVSAGT